MNLYKKYLSGVEKGIYILLSLLLTGILFLDLFFQNKSYACKKEFILPNVVLLCISLLFFLVISIIVKVKFEKLCIAKDNKFSLVNVVSVVLFVVLVYISLNIYFMTAWDAGGVICYAKMLARGEIIDGTYFSRYPNQQLLLVIETLFLKINDKFGVIDTGEGFIIIIFFQCLLYVVTGNLLYRVIIQYTNNKYCAWVGWIAFCVLLAFSGWVSIPYTDGLSMIFPVFILWCYQKKERISGYKRIICWGIIAALTYWGYKIKPTVLIVFIAIVCGELLYVFKEMRKENVKKIFGVFSIIVLISIFSSKVCQFVIDSTGIVINKELNTGVLHMVMMGLNDETDGAWYSDDVALSEGIPQKEERREAQIDRIEERLESYGIKGLIRHTARKSLVVFNDGTFAWGEEGNFYNQIYDERNNCMCPFLRNVFYNDGYNYSKIAAVEQAFWLLTIFLCIFNVLLKKDKDHTVIVLSLIGIVFFNLLFEARARYLMIYVPIFIIVGSISLERVSDVLVYKMRSVLVYCQNLVDKLGIDADEIINMKMAQNEAKYPVDKAKGSSAKYTDL